MVKRPYLSLRHPLLPLPSLNADPIHDWTTASPVGRPGGLEAGKMVEKTSRQSYSCAECKRSVGYAPRRSELIERSA